MKLNFLSLFLLANTLAQAQTYQRKTPEQKARKYTNELLAVIPLDSATEARAFQVNIQVSMQIDSLYATKPEKDDLRRAFAHIFRSRDSSFRSIFSPEQFLRYDDWQRELRERRLKEKAEKEKGKE